MRTEHGGIPEGRAYPSDSTLTNVTDLFSDYQIRSGALAPTIASGTTAISDMLSAPSSVLTPTLVSKINVLRGMDVTGYIAHNSAAQLGNYGPGGAGCSGCPSHPYIPTIDQVLAWSDSFYSSLAGIRERSLVLGNKGLSWGYSNPVAQSGNVIDLEADGRALPLFDRLFQDISSDPEPRRLVVDRVLEGYQRLSNGTFGAGRRLSSADRTRLEDHMQQLFELERRLTTATANCDVSTPPGNPPAPAYKSTDPTEQRLYYQALNEVVALAFKCDVTRVAVIDPRGDRFSSYAGGDWHGDVAHEGLGAQSADINLGYKRNFFEWVFLDLAQKLDVDEGGGQTILDNSLVFWGDESGVKTHDSQDVPCITAGSAGGYFNTGLYCDYRNRQSFELVRDPAEDPRRPGLTNNQWMGTILQSMGLARSEYERWEKPGYGIFARFAYSPGSAQFYIDAYPDRVWDIAGNPLPFIT